MVTEAEARRIRPMMSGIVALAVALVTAIGWYYIGRPDESQQPVPTMSTSEWQAWVRAARTDHKLDGWAPDRVPAGWRVRTATYQSGSDPAFHLGMLTEHGNYVGIEESRASISDAVEQYVDGNATRGEDVRIGPVTWQVWTDSGGDYALIRQLRAMSGEDETVLVVGSAPGSAIRSFAGTLSAPAPL